MAFRKYGKKGGVTAAAGTLLTGAILPALIVIFVVGMIARAATRSTGASFGGLFGRGSSERGDVSVGGGDRSLYLDFSRGDSQGIGSGFFSWLRGAVSR